MAQEWGRTGVRQTMAQRIAALSARVTGPPTLGPILLQPKRMAATVVGLARTLPLEALVACTTEFAFRSDVTPESDQIRRGHSPSVGW